jgi:hypothetical protein
MRTILAGNIPARKSFAARLFSRSLTLSLLALFAVGLRAQTAVNPQQKPTPAKLEKQFIIFPDSVVIEQWPHTLKLVNAPQNLNLLNPGQCIRIGIVVTGDNRDDLLAKTQLSFRVDFAGKAQDHVLAPFAATKQIKPEGGDFVTAALAAADIQNPLPTFASLGASAEKWCVPADAGDGTAFVDAEAETPAGHQKLARAKIQIESFDAGSKHTFKDEGELNNFITSYHYQPNPARLLPALQFFASDAKFRDQTGSLETTAAFLGAALKADPTAAKDFMERITPERGFAQAFGLLVLLNAGYDINPVLKTFSEEGRQRFAKHPILPDPFDFTHVEDIGTRLDMLWSIFMSTGQFAPVQKIASALEWQPDWKAFDKARKSSNPPKEWTPAIGRAIGYGAAGWALGSFQRTDPLAADYIEFMIASPETPEVVKTELKGLGTNPAFKWQDKK